MLRQNLETAQLPQVWWKVGATVLQGDLTLNWGGIEGFRIAVSTSGFHMTHLMKAFVGYTNFPPVRPVQVARLLILELHGAFDQFFLFLLGCAVLPRFAEQLSVPTCCVSQAIYGFNCYN